MTKIIMMFALSIVVLFQGCAYRYTYMPTMTIAGPALESDKFRVNDYQMVNKDVVSQDILPIIIIFPIIGTNQKLVYGMIDNAIQKICKEKNYAFLTNVRIYQESWYIPYIYGQIKFVVKCEGWSSIQKSEVIQELQHEGFNIAFNN